MAKLMKQESALVTDDESSFVQPEIGVASEAAAQGELSGREANPPPTPWIGSISRSSYGVMHAVNENGYLVPLWTAGDLLRACKIIWRSTRN